MFQLLNFIRQSVSLAMLVSDPPHISRLTIIGILFFIMLVWMVYDFGRQDEHQRLKAKAQEWMKKNGQG